MALTTMKVFLYLGDPAATLAAGYDRIKVEVTDDNGVTWIEHSDADTRLVVEDGKYNYHYILTDGSVTARYRAVLSDSNGVVADIPQSPQQAIDTSFESFVSIDELKTVWLFSIDLTGDDGTPYPDELFAHFISAAVAQAEMEFDIVAFPRPFTKRYDWYRRDWEQFGFLKLDEKPVISVEELSIRYPNQQGDSAIITFPSEWIQLDGHASVLNVYPGNGIMATSLITLGGGYLPFLFGAVDMLPGLIRCKFTAGLSPMDRRRPLLKEYVGKLASMGPLNIAGDLVAGAGIAAQSISIDGLSRSVTTSNSSTNAGYGARILGWQKELKGMKSDLRRHFGGLKMTVA